MPHESRSVLAVSIVAAAVLWNSTVLAYSAIPSRGHAVLSNLAIDLFNKCVERGYGEPEFLLNRNERERIVKANLNEDRTRPLRRALNWHFYHPQMESRQRTLLFINRSFIPLFSRIEARLNESELSWNDALHALGRAIHFMEDLTVPAHSVPVFHGAGLKDAFESFRLSGTPSAQALKARISPNIKMICYRLSSQRPYAQSDAGAPGAPSGEGSLSLREILNRTRSFTLARLDNWICDEPDSLRVSWHYFWLPPKDDRFFGAYREGAEFGQVSDITDNGMSCQVTAEKYRNFAAGLHLEAVFADVRTLYWFSEKHAREPAPGLAPRLTPSGHH